LVSPLIKGLPQVATLGLDYAGGVPHAAAITSAGYSFVVRYLTAGGPGLPGKLLTALEYAALQSAGVAVVFNFETTADRMKGGRAAGIADAKTAHNVITALGAPLDRPIYFSADWDAAPHEQPLIDAYLDGAASVVGLHRVGVYGSYYVVKRCLDNNTARWAWQTGAWSGGQREPRAHIYQRIGFATVGGVECDVNEALQPDFGQHPPYLVKRGAVDMPAGSIAPGKQVTKLVMPIGSASMLVARGWLSLASTEAGTAKVWVQAPQGEIPYDVNFVKDRRWYIELPDGTDQMTIHTDTPGAVGWALELQPR
jgi:glycoside hydrolase-like protein